MSSATLSVRRPVRPAALAAALLAGAVVLTACGDRSGKTLDDPVFPPPATTTTVPALAEPPPTVQAVPAPMVLVAPWVDDAMMPERHTCQDVGVPPALSWGNVPFDAVELALTVTDLDLDDRVHWIVYGIAPFDGGFPEGSPPAGAFEWVNESGTTGWEPPCPPPGETHRFRFTVHALNQQLETADDAPAREVMSIIDAITIDRASTVGRVTGS